MTAMNVAAYAFTLVAARRLGPTEYSAVAALMGVVLVANVIALGVQATTARRVALAGPNRDPGPLVAAGNRAALVLAAAALALSPAAAAVFRLDSWATAAPVAVTAGALTVTGVRLGLAQGRRQWGTFAAVSAASGAGRVVVGGAALWLWPSAFGAMAGVALGALVPVAVGAALVADPSHASPRRVSAVVVGREVLHDSHLLLAFFALTQVDVFVARATLPTAEAGLYASGLILAKAVLFLPTFVTVLAYPMLARRGRHRHVHHRGLLIILAIGLVAVCGVLVLPDLGLAFVGGAAYAAVRDELWVFATLGTATAMVQLLVQTAVARQHRTAVAWVWGALAAVLVGVPFVEDGRGLLLLVLAVDVALLAVLLVVTWADDPAVPAEEDDALAEALSTAEGDDGRWVSARRRARSGRRRR